MKLLQAFALAWNMLTIIPFLQVHNFYKGINGLSAFFYPIVGFLLGFLLYAFSKVLAFSFSMEYIGVIVFFLWILLTGAIHLDGLSDTIDGLFVPKEKALKVMKDSSVGGMGMIFTGSFLILKAATLSQLHSFWILPVVLSLSRMGIVVAIYNFSYISSGVGALIKEELSKKLVVAVLAFSIVITLVYGVVWAFIVVLLFTMITASLFRKRYGGLSGDIYGFIVEANELLLLILCVAAGL